MSTCHNDKDVLHAPDDAADESVLFEVLNKRLMLLACKRIHIDQEVERLRAFASKASLPRLLRRIETYELLAGKTPPLT